VTLVCDTGPLLASIDRDDPDHLPCVQLLEATDEVLVIPGLVLGEVDYWCRKLRLHKAWAEFLDDLLTGAWRLEWPTHLEIERIRDLGAKYLDLDLGIVDASVVALAERLQEDKIATLDHRHFSVVRPAHVGGFTLLP
jgi:predicted nucleic acid-binding protein